jgi:hypothetical protein
MTTTRLTAVRRFWRAEESLSILLALLVVSELIVPAVWPDKGPRDPVTGAFLSFVLLAGAATVWSHARRWLRVVAGVCVLAAVAWWSTWFSPGGFPEAARPAATVVVLILLAFVVMASVLRAGTVTRHQIEGAIAAFLLLALAFAGAYEWIAMQDPSAFRGADLTGSHQWTYYSLVTITTMGYGDIVPVAPAARSLAVAEAVTGQMYIAILISRLVALSLAARNK